VGGENGRARDRKIEIIRRRFAGARHYRNEATFQSSGSSTGVGISELQWRRFNREWKKHPV